MRVVSALVLFAASVLAPPSAPIATAQGVAAPPTLPTGYRVIRSTSGSRGRVSGATFVVEDPRTVFRAPDDRQVIVHFEWEGPPGKHRLEGLWRSPEGRVATITEFEHETRGPRLAAYFELALPTSPTTGTWTLDVRVDGQPAGSHRFDIVAGPDAPTPVAGTPPPPPLPAGELYARLQAATVVVHKLDAAGRVALTAAGCVVAPDRVAVPFHVVDGAARLRVTSATGQSEEVTHLAAFDRTGDWALLPIALPTVKPLPRAAPKDSLIGAYLYSLDIAPTGERALYDISVRGSSSRPGAGERLVLASPVPWRMAGTPVIDAYGGVTAIVGAIWEPGTAVHDTDGAIPIAAPSAVPMLMGGSALALPIAHVVDDGKPPRSLSVVATIAPFVPVFGPSRVHVVRGYTSQSVRRSQPFFEAVDPKAEFSKARGTFAVLLELYPKEKFAKLPVAVTLYDASGRPAGAAKPATLKGEPSRPLGVSWAIDPAALPPGRYRVDVGAVGDVMWRTFIDITP